MNVPSLLHDCRKLLAVMVPVLITQVSTVGMNFIDTAMSGHAGAADLAGVSVGANLFMPLMVGIMSILAAATPIIAQLLGRKEKAAIPAVVRTGLYLAFLAAVTLLTAYWLGIDALMQGLALEPDVEHVARYYLLAVVIGSFFQFLVMPFRALTDTVGSTTLSMSLFLAALPVNGLLNYMFIFGMWGAPRLGGIGAGVATALTYALLLFLFITVTVYWDDCFQGRAIVSSLACRWSSLREYLAIGIPNGLGAFMESSLFGFIIIFMTPFGTDILASHQAAMNFSGLIYMVPLSFSMALTILVGIEVGAHRYDQARRFGRLGVALALGCGMTAATLSILGRNVIASIYAGDAALIPLIGHFLIYTAAWQTFDGIACPIQGILRGYKDVRVPFALMMVAYWGICFPTGILLDTYTDAGPYSYWQGLVLGVMCSAGLLTFRLRRIERKYQP
ncbi:MATE family efflux transporter [uncultured Megasphaera sp.]|uniref:MATE family efflux transporter n=1 Tax=uncultured Megasphaera sp. TaxID=165188 RepID=UPI0026586DA9|nr:MATE family efflux transporter [uncultured Megasphaera sp.]